MRMLSLLFRNKEAKFWDWFQENENRLFNFKKEQEVILNELSNQLIKVNDNLTFELSHNLKDGKREFILSAAGIKSAFPAVEKLCSKAPCLDRWDIIKYRQRRDSISDITYSDKKVQAEDVYFAFFKDENPKKIALILFFKDYKDTEEIIWGQIGYLFLDEALGEYDVEDKVGAIKFDSVQSEYFKYAQPIKMIQQEFDHIFKDTFGK